MLQDGETKALLGEDVLRRIVGEGARDRGGKGNANVGDGGVAFVLTSASAVPGSAELVRTPPPVVVSCSMKHVGYTIIMQRLCSYVLV